MQEVEGEPLFCERAAGIDIGKASVFVTIRVPSEAREGGRQQETREFGTTRRNCWHWRTGCAAGAWRKRAWSPPAITGSRCSSAGAGGLRVPALPGVAGQGTARAARDRQAGLGMACQDN